MTNAEKFKDTFGGPQKEDTGVFRTDLVYSDNVVTFDRQWGESEYRHKGVYECFNCGTESVIWDSDFDFEDLGYDGKGIVHICHCENCGAEIEYRIPIPDEDEDESTGNSSEEHTD